MSITSDAPHASLQGWPGYLSSLEKLSASGPEPEPPPSRAKHPPHRNTSAERRKDGRVLGGRRNTESGPRTRTRTRKPTQTQTTRCRIVAGLGELRPRTRLGVQESRSNYRGQRECLMHVPGLDWTPPRLPVNPTRSSDFMRHTPRVGGSLCRGSADAASGAAASRAAASRAAGAAVARHAAGAPCAPPAPTASAPRPRGAGGWRHADRDGGQRVPTVGTSERHRDNRDGARAQPAILDPYDSERVKP
jgi:hypothetical protein